ncbi:uncharacterized protein lrrc66 [Austrofundulus limnaeus]|uniref:Uncharacterized protein lrrc66 n=1 Tax=Austrofundulus limnaeus TaxID=52670 RepID=A0A2I4CSM6_AUSLI|nr:PREDICTED: leucine-rich repeat-containing protein 66 [Austrofundulus limnaeus]
MKAERKNLTQSDLTLAVCLSVFITFLFAFVLGVLLRPYIDVLWKRVTTKKSTSAANTVSTVEQGQYVNEAFSSAEEPEDRGSYRERRVTFSTEENNVQYFDTVVRGDSISSDAVFEDEVVVSELHNQTNTESGSEHLLQRGLGDKQSDDSHSGDSNECRIRNKEFEHIPEPDELGERKSRSSSSDSSLLGKLSEEEQITKRKPTKSKSPQLVEDSLQQRLNLSSKIEDTQISMEGKIKIPKRSSRSVDFSLNTSITNPLDSDDLHDNEELFDFSDSAQSPTTGSSNVFDSFNNPKQSRTPSSVNQKKRNNVSLLTFLCHYRA